MIATKGIESWEAFLRQVVLNCLYADRNHPVKEAKLIMQEKGNMARIEKKKGKKNPANGLASSWNMGTHS